MTSLRFTLLGMMKNPFFKRICSNMLHRPSLYHTSVFRLGNNAIEIKMPALSPTMTEGTIVKWLKKEGDTISPGDVLCEIQTDKAVVALETEEEGILSKIHIPENTSDIKLGEVIAIIIGEGSSEDTMPNAPILADANKPTEFETLSKNTNVLSSFFGPSVRKLLEEYGLKFSDVPSSGPHSVLLKGDVLNYISSNKLKQMSMERTPSAASGKKPKLLKTTSHIDIPLTSSQRTIAEEFSYSKTMIPHAYMSADCKIDEAHQLESQMKTDNPNITLNDFVVKSAASALRKVPTMNVIYLNGQTVPMETVNVILSDSSFTVSIIKNADSLSVQDISVRTDTLQTEGNISSQGTNCALRIMNLGRFGVFEFCELVHSPEVAILAVGAERFVFEDETSVRKINVTLSFDRRAVADDDAGLFLSYFRQCLENPFLTS